MSAYVEICGIHISKIKIILPPLSMILIGDDTISSTGSSDEITIKQNDLHYLL